MLKHRAFLVFDQLIGGDLAFLKRFQPGQLTLFQVEDRFGNRQGLFLCIQGNGQLFDIHIGTGDIALRLGNLQLVVFRCECHQNLAFRDEFTAFEIRIDVGDPAGHLRDGIKCMGRIDRAVPGYARHEVLRLDRDDTHERRRFPDVGALGCFAPAHRINQHCCTGNHGGRIRAFRNSNTAALLAMFARRAADLCRPQFF